MYIQKIIEKEITIPYATTQKRIHVVQLTDNIKNPKRFVRPALADAAADYIEHIGRNPGSKLKSKA